jgi:cathepsin A (carboxypeptidase C)
MAPGWRLQHLVWLLLLASKSVATMAPPKVHKSSQLAYWKRQSSHAPPDSRHRVPEGFCGTTRQETGYVGFENKQYFYWFGESKRAPATDPLILWLSGGPGCSSSLAVLVENGPCKLKIDETCEDCIQKPINAVDNPYTWTSNSNVLWLDQPAGVGFSYKFKDTAISDSKSAQVAIDVLGFLTKWLAGHPKLQNRPLFIFGESYGGHFAPAAAKAIIQHNKRVKIGTTGGAIIQLKGIGVGDAMVDPQVQYQYYGKYLDTLDPTLRRGFLSDKDVAEMKANTPACIKGINKCMEDKSTCPQAKLNCCETFLGPIAVAQKTYFDVRKQTCENPLWCYDFRSVISWMTDPSTTAALGVHKQSEKWAVCNLKINSHFSTDWMMDLHKDAAVILDAGVRILVYAGEMDFIGNWVGCKAWTMRVNFEGKDDYAGAPDAEWHRADGKLLGNVRSAGGLTFAKVANAGHMVPMDQPEAALLMINQWMTTEAPYLT